MVAVLFTSQIGVSLKCKYEKIDPQPKRGNGGNNGTDGSNGVNGEIGHIRTGQSQSKSRSQLLVTLEERKNVILSLNVGKQNTAMEKFLEQQESGIYGDKAVLHGQEGDAFARTIIDDNLKTLKASVL